MLPACTFVDERACCGLKQRRSPNGNPIPVRNPIQFRVRLASSSQTTRSSGTSAKFQVDHVVKGGEAVLKKLAVVAICLAFLCGSAMAQDAKTVIANAQKALGDVKSITYSGSAKDVAFQQCGANATDMMCRGTHDPMRPINNYVRVIDLTAPASRAHGSDEQYRSRRLDDADAWNVLPAGHGPAGRCVATLGQLPGVLHHALGFPERRRGEQRHREPPQGRWQELHRPDLEPDGQGAFRQELRHQRLRG